MGFLSDDPESRAVATKIIIGVAVTCAIGNAVCIFAPVPWHIKATHIWNFNVGLYNVDVNDKTLGSFVFKGLLKGVLRIIKNKEKANVWTKKFSDIMSPGSHSVQDMKNQLCNIQLLLPVADNCWMWTRMQYGGWAMMLGLILTIVLLILGASLIMCKETRCLRASALAVFSAAAIVNIGSLAGYVMLTYNFSIWLSELHLSHNQLTFAYMSLVATMIALVVGLLPACFFLCVGIPHKNDDFYDAYDAPPDMMGGGYPTDQYGVPVEQGGASDWNQGAQAPYQDTYQDPYAASATGYVGGPPGPGYGGGGGYGQGY